MKEKKFDLKCLIKRNRMLLLKCIVSTFLLFLFYFSVGFAHDTWKQVGVASWYGRRFHGRKTASGQVYDMYKLTAAHRTLSFGTRVKVTHISNSRWVVVMINDRGPYKYGRIIDLSWAAARELGMVRQGIAKVKIEAF